MLVIVINKIIFLQKILRRPALYYNCIKWPPKWDMPRLKPGFNFQKVMKLQVFYKVIFIFCFCKQFQLDLCLNSYQYNLVFLSFFFQNFFAVREDLMQIFSLKELLQQQCCELILIITLPNERMMYIFNLYSIKGKFLFEIKNFQLKKKKKI